jgi:inositol transport system substrate-binding protein
MRGGEAIKWNEANCPGVKLLAHETGKWNREYSRTVMENYLTTYKDKVNLVYCHNDDMCQGAAKAIQEAGLKGKVKVLSVDGGNKEEYDCIRSGLCYGTILNDASFIATGMIHTARDLMENRPILPQYISPATLVTKDNVDGFTAWW